MSHNAPVTVAAVILATSAELGPIPSTATQRLRRQVDAAWAGGATPIVGAGVVLVSDQASGTDGFAESLLRHHARPVRKAQRPEWNPREEHLDWHGREVFKGTARHAG